MKDDGIRWVRVARGFYLLGIGTFLLLTTQDLLPASFWSDVLAYWPVFLVAIGIRLVFERSPLPWLVLLGPILVLGTMMYVAMHAGERRGVYAGDWETVRIEGPPDAAASPITLEGRLALAHLDVESRRLPRNVLLDGRFTEAGSRSVRVEDTGTGRLRIANTTSKGTSFFVPGRRKARCEIGVPSDRPMAIDLDLAFTETRFDVASGPVSRLSFDGAFNEMRVRLGEPSGEVRLDFEGAFNQIAIEVPARTRVSVSSEGFMNVVDRRGEDADAAGGSGAGSVGAGMAGAPGYRLRLQGAFNRVVVRPV